MKDKLIPETNKIGFEVVKTKLYHENYNNKTLKGVYKPVLKNEKKKLIKIMSRY